MYESFFGLRRRPFPATADSRAYVPVESIESARQTLLRVIERAEGVGAIFGPTGAGKTLLCQLLSDECSAEFHVAFVAAGRIGSRRALLQCASHVLDLPYRGLAEGELRLAVIDRLTGPSADGRALLFIADNAHLLPTRLLDELRMLTDLAAGGQSRVRLVLSGAPNLDERLAQPQLESLNQRVAARCMLVRLNATESAVLIRQQLMQAGVEPSSVFDDEAVRAVSRAADGVPRLVNQICDHALILAMMREVRPVGAALVEEAWADLAQLPIPSAAQTGEGTPATIEFGLLDPEETSDCIPFRPLADADEIPVQQGSQTPDEFLPPSTARPELTIDFGPAGNPFCEWFDREEIVLDRYSGQEGGLWAGRPVVATREGRELARLLNHLRSSAAATADAVPDFELARDWAGGRPAAPPALGAVPDEPLAPAANQFLPEQLPPKKPPAPVSQPGRYRHLFAKLRG